jgi:hypothetical protein
MKDMINKDTLFCDTYALIQICLGGENYGKYIKYTLITSDYNLMELYYSFLKNFGRKVANHYFQLWCTYSVQIPQRTIKYAMQFRLKHKKERLSYIDCIGYVFSYQKNIRFLTGDQKFKNKQGVEFVK